MQVLFSFPALIDPIRYKQIRISCSIVIPVTAEDNLLTIGAEHGKWIKYFIKGDLFEASAIFGYHEQVELKATLAFVITAEDYLLTVGMIEWSPVGFA